MDVKGQEMILVTGCAGFIGYHVCHSLLSQGFEVLGIDNLNDYYDVSLKKARLANLIPQSGFEFQRLDISDSSAMLSIATTHPDITHIIHLAAQAGVRYSLINPYAYGQTNLMGQICLLELAKRLPKLEHMVYASTSSVYGANEKLPFSVSDPTDHPVSLYAASKKGCELISESYAHMFQLPLTGLRFFTVYGPWGRPDMALFIFTKAILAREKVPVFNQGNMRRNFTYVDDIVSGTLGAVFHERAPGDHKLYNLGNNKSESLMDYLGCIEKSLGLKADVQFEPMQVGDVTDTVADIKESVQEFNFNPTTDIDQGVPQFIKWYMAYYHQEKTA